MTSLLPTRPRARVLTLAALVGVLVVVLSPVFGRAEVTGAYRPVVPPDGLTTGCYPLPGDVELDVDYVLRRDGLISSAFGLRRQVVVHVDGIDPAEAAARTERLFEDAGVLDQVRVSARDFEGVGPDSVIRGELVLDLPPVGPSSDSEDCLDLYSTKRFTPDLPDRS